MTSHPNSRSASSSFAFSDYFHKQFRHVMRERKDLHKIIIIFVFDENERATTNMTCSVRLDDFRKSNW